MREWLYDVFRERPWWMSATMIFCAWMAFVYVPWDLFVKPIARDEEIWFGIDLRGALAKLGAVAQPLRAALTGRSTSPGVFDVLAVLGREESLARIHDKID